MKKFIETIRNIFKIEELKSRLAITFLLVIVYRFGSYIALPGIDTTQLSELSKQTSGGLMMLLDMFSGGAFSNASIFALGIMPYISASIVVQLLGMAFPYFQKLQREGESGRQRMNQITRYLTILILLLQGPAYLINLRMQIGSVVPEGAFFMITSVLILAAGSMFVLWLGERITEKGVGNGISFIILVGIIARFPRAIVGEFSSRLHEAAGGLVLFLAEIVFLLVVIGFSVLLVQGTRKVPVQYAKRVVGNRQYGGVRQYIPLKINAAGVMPIIFAQALMLFPMLFSRWDATRGLAATLGNYTGFWYNFIFFILIVIFTYFYTAVTVNPTMMAESMKRDGGFIPGVKPGKKTVEYLDAVMSKVTFPGSLFLGIISILPAIAVLFGINNSFSSFYGGTSLLILVGVILDTLQQVESYLLMRHYDGLMKTGRLSGRSGM